MPPDAESLRLRAEDADDLAVISACLQDALVSVRDLTYDPAARSFVLIANRFRWECGGRMGDEPPFERILSWLGFEEVGGAAYRGFQRSEEDRILSLLAIRSRPEASGGSVDLEFAAGATVRLTTSQIRCRLRDLGEPWPTRWHPDHPADGPK